MNKIAVFTEGQGELIFVRYLLLQTVNPEHLSFECHALRSSRLHSRPYKYCSPNATVHYLIVDIGNDETVLSAIAERQEYLVSKGYDLIIGLRDMYSKAYCKRSRQIDDAVTRSFIESHKNTIRKMDNCERIRIFFAIMELESWLLSMYNLFEKIHADLSCEYIESKLGFNLSQINPEVEFFHPATKLSAILELVGEKYTKSFDRMESILGNMVRTDIDDALENGRRSVSFDTFFSAVTNR